MYWSKYKTHLAHGIKANTCLQMCSIFIYLCVRSGAGVDCVTAHPWGLSAESRPLTTSQGWGKKGSCLGRTLSFPCSVKQARTILEVRGIILDYLLIGKKTTRSLDVKALFCSGSARIRTCPCPPWLPAPFAGLAGLVITAEPRALSW